MTPDRLSLWPVRIAWLGLPLATGAAFADAIDGASEPVRWVAIVGLYTAWAGGLLALLVPRTVGLTALRIGGPAALAATAGVVVGGGRPGVVDVVAIGWAALVCGTALAGFTADALVDGSSYGAERRFVLRTPVVVLLGPAELAWLAVVSGVIGPPLLLAARQWVLGGIAVVLGAGAAWAGVRALHQLSRRWVVFVPAGVVVHDPLATTDPVLFPRRTIAGMGPAAAAEPAPSVVDLGGGATGLVLEMEVHPAIDIPLRAGRGRRATTVAADRVRFTPVRPGAVLAEAGARRLSDGRRQRDRGRKPPR